jgi:hypothetical protein
MLVLIFTTNPRTAALLERVRQSGTPGSSGVVARRTAGAADDGLEEEKVG